jgi:hypothetical protein
MKIIEILKEDQQIDASSMEKAGRNVCNYEEEIYLQPIDENWTQKTAFSQK